MAQAPIGAIAAVRSFDDTILEVVIMGQEGTLHHVNCCFEDDEPEPTDPPNYLLLSDGQDNLGSRWTDRGVLCTAHARAHVHSKLTACTIEDLELACLFYQLQDGSIVMRRCGVVEWNREMDYITVVPMDNECPPLIGTSIVVQPSIVAAGGDAKLMLFYQTTSGEIAIQMVIVTQPDRQNEPLFRGELSIPPLTPFAVLTSENKFTISYILNAQEIWEYSGSLDPDPCCDFETHKYEVTATRSFLLKKSPTPGFTQISSYQTDHPIFYATKSSSLDYVVWSSACARRTYCFEDRGMPGTPVALSGHTSNLSNLIILFVDANGAVNVGLLGAGSVDGATKPQCSPIPLESMRNAFTWVQSSVTSSTLEIYHSSTKKILQTSASQTVGGEQVQGTGITDNTTSPSPSTIAYDSAAVGSNYTSTSGNKSFECNQPSPCPEPNVECPISPCMGARYRGENGGHGSVRNGCSEPPIAQYGVGQPIFRNKADPTHPESEAGSYPVEEDGSCCGDKGGSCGEEDGSCSGEESGPYDEEVSGPCCGGQTQFGKDHEPSCSGDESTHTRDDRDSSPECDSTSGGEHGTENTCQCPGSSIGAGVEGQGNVCSGDPDKPPAPNKTNISTRLFDHSTQTEDKTTTSYPAGRPPSVSSPGTQSTTPSDRIPAASQTTPTAPLAPISGGDLSPEPSKPAPEVLGTLTNQFVDTLYERLRFLFKPLRNQYISLQLPARRLDQVTSMYMGTESTNSVFNSAISSELDFKLSDELFDTAKFVSGPSGKSISQEYERILYNLIPNPNTEVYRRLTTQRDIILKHLMEQADSNAPPRCLGGSTLSNQVARVPQSEIRQDIAPSKPARITTGSNVLHDEHARLGFPNDMTQLAGPNTRLRLLHSPTSAYTQNFNVSSPPDTPRVTESFSAIHASALVRGRMHIVKELMAYLEVKTSSEFLYDAKVKFRDSIQSFTHVSSSTLPVTMKPVDWYEASQTSWSADELTQDLATLQNQLDQKLSDMDSLTAQLLPFMSSSTEDFQEAELEIQALIKERDSAQCALESGYTTSIIAPARVASPNLCGSDDYPASLLGCTHTTSSDDCNSSTLSGSPVTKQLGDLKIIDRKLLGATRLLAIKRARATMAKSGGPTLQMKSMLESKILEHQVSLEAGIKSAQLSSERYALKLQSSIAQVHLPYSSDPRWSIVSISSEVLNTTWHNPKAGFGLWMGPAVNSPRSTKAVKIDIGFRVSVIEADRRGWLEPEFMKHSSQYMRLPGGARWSEWPGSVQAPEEIVERILRGSSEIKGDMPALPIGYLVAKDILIKIHTPDQSEGTIKQDLVKQAATSNGILCFEFSPQASAHGHAGATYINEYSDGIVFRIPEAQILGYLMELTPPDFSIEYDPDLVDSNIEVMLTDEQ